ncbi:MAG: hypothetical protein VW226_12880 [Rhodospirillaceae bacterium]
MIRSYTLTVFLTLTCITIPIAALNAQVSFRTVEASGHGVTPEQAVDRALVGAITQVNGAAIASRARSSLASKTSVSDGKSSSISQKTFQETIAKKTKGIVKSFEILSQEKPANSSLFRVNLSVTVATYKQSAQLNRLRMAVVPFRIDPSISSRAASSKFEDYTRRGIENYLTQTRRFAIIDRSFISEQNKELNFLLGKEGSGNSPGGSPMEELARIGNRVGTDYLVTGVVEKAYSTNKIFKMQSTGQVIKTPQIGGRVTYRILDVASSQVKLAGTEKIHRESGSLDSVADALSKQIGEKILNAIFPIFVLSIEGNQVTLGQGGDTVKNGGIYSLVRLGKEIIDPYTRESLGQKETVVGAVRVIDTQSKLSTARIVDLRISSSDLMRDDYIVRPKANPIKNSQIQKKKTMKKIEKEIDNEMDKEFEKD